MGTGLGDADGSAVAVGAGVSVAAGSSVGSVIGCCDSSGAGVSTFAVGSSVVSPSADAAGTATLRQNVSARSAANHFFIIEIPSFGVASGNSLSRFELKYNTDFLNETIKRCKLYVNRHKNPLKKNKKRLHFSAIKW